MSDAIQAYNRDAAHSGAGWWKSPNDPDQIALADVRAAYRWILGRDPDPHGLTQYARQMAEGSIDWQALRAAMLASPEFIGRRSAALLVDLLEGVKVVVDAGDGDIGAVVATHRTWEPHITAVVGDRLREGDVFVDIGSNVGVMSFVAAKAVGSAGKVIGFEPNPTNAANYRRGIAANGFGNVLLHNLAVSDRPCLITISPHTNGKATEGADPLGSSEVVQAVALDDFLAHKPRIDFVKIDIEGYEMRAFAGMRKLLDRHKPLMQIEFNPLCLKAQGGIDPRDFADVMFDLSRGPVQIVEHDRSLTRIDDAASLMAERELRNRRAVADGHLPEDWLHLDILLKVA
jgi:FkbM family methyltransferase